MCLPHPHRTWDKINIPQVGCCDIPHSDLLDRKVWAPLAFPGSFGQAREAEKWHYWQKLQFPPLDFDWSEHTEWPPDESFISSSLEADPEWSSFSAFRANWFIISGFGLLAILQKLKHDVSLVGSSFWEKQGRVGLLLPTEFPIGISSWIRFSFLSTISRNLHLQDPEAKVEEY